MRRPAAGSGCLPALCRALASISDHLPDHERGRIRDRIRDRIHDLPAGRLPRWAGIAALVWASHAQAGSFTVNPVRVELSAAAPTAVLQVENIERSPITIQLSTMAWAQPAGNDELQPSRDILATPQIFTLKPGATQILRIGLMRKPDAAQELGYRLLMEEIPPPPAPDFRGLQVALRVSLPVFVKPATEGRPRLTASIERRAEQHWHLTLTNHGNAAARLQGLTVHPTRDPQQTLAAYPSAVYVLPGQRRELAFRPAESSLDDVMLIKAVMHGTPLELHATPAGQ